MAKRPSLPSVQKLCLSAPLFEEFAFDKDQSNPLFALEAFNGTLDCHCPGCGRHSVFSRMGKPVNEEYAHLYNHIFALLFSCSRENVHQIIFIFRSHQGSLQKIGQFPSLADLTAPDLLKYRPVLGEERHRELSRAIGLASHGIGIGAFVYLRRIFESLVEEAHKVALGDDDWNDGTYQRARMDEKILLLKSRLPQFLVENRSLYSIMSVAVHALSEQECMEAFPVARVAIELILDSRLEDHQRSAKIAAAAKEIGALKAQIRGPDAAT